MVVTVKLCCFVFLGWIVICLWWVSFKFDYFENLLGWDCFLVFGYLPFGWFLFDCILVFVVLFSFDLVWIFVDFGLSKTWLWI